jgi:hypothetical protein
MRLIIITLLTLLAPVSLAEDILTSSDLMSYAKLSRLSNEYREFRSAAQSGVEPTEDQKMRRVKLHKLIRAEHDLRMKFFKEMKVKGQLTDYPGLLEKLNIMYEKAFAPKGSKTYCMSFLNSIFADEGDPILYLAVDATNLSFVKRLTHYAR